MSASLPVLSPDLASSLLDLSTFGEITLPPTQAQFTFQMDIVPAESPEEIWFGILATDTDASGLQVKAGMAVRIDLARGEIWDALNGMGLLGTLEMGPLGLGRYDAENTLMIQLKVDKHGQNLLPTLEIGDETCLYPSISTTAVSDAPMIAVAGAVQPGRDAEPFCQYPAFWLTQAI